MESCSRKHVEVSPLQSVEELLSWTGLPDDLKSYVDNVCGVATPRTICHRAPKTIVCHDMKGGYIEDRFCESCPNKNAYRFYNWSSIDVFIYFSHNFVTIPPLGWIQAGHLHGVKVYGTIITEWDKGKEICDQILLNDESMDVAVSILVKIAVAYKFDGWLVNIENVISANKVTSLTTFVRKLTSLMHEQIKGSEVIWYDSVINSGELAWQNELNSSNKCFFDECDGIFLNYSWNEDHLSRSCNVAGDRIHDVYVGLDVFGRNFYEGGGFNTFKAMQVVRKHGLSAAIFAQGWTYENFEIESFEENEHEFWGPMCGYMLNRGPTFLPFKTYFCQGFGTSCYKEGKVVCDAPWYNLSKQQYQPIWYEKSSPIVKNVMDGDSYNGGSCLMLNAKKNGYSKLFTCDFKCRNGLLITITYKWVSPPELFFINLLNLSLKEEKQMIITLACTEQHIIPDQHENNILIKYILKEVNNGWTTRVFHVENLDGCIKEISLFLSLNAQIMLGELSVENV